MGGKNSFPSHIIPSFSTGKKNFNNLTYHWFRNGRTVWAKLHHEKVTWIFTKTSHGNEPGDPVMETNTLAVE